MKELLADLLEHLLQGLLGILLITWWLGGPAVTAIVWDQQDPKAAWQFLALWATATALYFLLRAAIRRLRRS
ncbi:hypothetical protein GQS52_26800 [Streptomyces sp. SCUT-3]|uniref:hypothetical protein n=1 Tax=Streptomyces sp. SCUT-3 TaxID=2684469 RepID=UPI000CB85413|nr:hypothetical protein [Streptomyces sp. SCUT-3]PLW69814.1 hypothetical protein C0036_20275 [Streptomyces sp. DJ]QMV20473.1 hypothetical protein GQS52_00060 [Streptomyces sp. SCUT-3]QMV22632.1 hypothetical protein GQS52_13525 [Streptomyces sp. SCUT-3]QMV24769.1 hypothetical protein GQS52_26800 [Streptomyces sp. SCUT-3]